MSRALLLLLAACLLPSQLGCRAAGQREAQRPAGGAEKEKAQADVLKLRDLLYCDMTLDETLGVFADDVEVARAVGQVRAKDYEGALGTLRKFEGRGGNSDDFPGWVVTAAAQRGAGRPAEAKAAVRRALSSEESRVRLQGWAILRELGEAPRPQEAREVLGVVVEYGMDDGVSIVAGYADGVGRLFLSDGAGLIGEPLPEPVQKAARQLVREGARVGGGMKPGARGGLPGREKVRVTLLTPSGPLVAEEEADRINEPGHPLHGVFRDGGLLFAEMTKVYGEK